MILLVNVAMLLEITVCYLISYLIIWTMLIERGLRDARHDARFADEARIAKNQTAQL
jgi:hypothetical protein